MASHEPIAPPSALLLALDDESPHAENVEVRSSHCGMGYHPSVLLGIAERLARPAAAGEAAPAAGRAGST